MSINPESIIQMATLIIANLVSNSSDRKQKFRFLLFIFNYFFFLFDEDNVKVNNSRVNAVKKH